MLDKTLKQMLQQTLTLLEREATLPKNKAIVDYGFLVFTAAIVYEGFLKRFLYAMGLTSLGQFRSDRFRIGKALNPDLPERYRDDGWVFDGVVRYCGMGLAMQLWEAWKLGRNRVFHYDIDGRQYIDLTEAEMRVARFLEAMVAAMQCERRVKREELMK